MYQMQIKKLSQIDRALNTAACRVLTTSLSSLMQMPNRSRFIYQCDDLTVDCTRQPLDDDALACLFDLADACQLQKRIDQMFCGAPINTSENQSVQHPEFRRPDHQNTADYKKCVDFAEAVRSNPEITAVVNLGTGGSDLGPKLVTEALAGYHDGPDCYFVGNMCPTDLHDTLGKCTPRKTLFIITSKTFTTAETMANAAIARNWLEQHGVDAGKAIVAVTAAGPRAREWGIDPQQIFTFSKGVGGRYSLWSPAGLAAMIAIGKADFLSILAGGYAMDCHVQQAELQQNIGVIMGLLRVWHRTYLHRPAYGLIPYDQRLAQLPAWAQQLEMESNGKGVDRHGHVLQRPAGPLLWGAPGTNAQHSFFQWLHQSVDVIPIDVLVAMQPAAGLDQAISWESHKALAINAVAQAEALALGTTNTDEPHRHFPGNRPSVLISWDKTTPYALGRLLALYEHITVISGFIWDVNSFDQWGVELGKHMAKQLQLGAGVDAFSPAAQAFLHRLNKH
jgi:glucose-6-phosphate isomerase